MGEVKGMYPPNLLTRVDNSCCHPSYFWNWEFRRNLRVSNAIFLYIRSNIIFSLPCFLLVTSSVITYQPATSYDCVIVWPASSQLTLRETVLFLGNMPPRLFYKNLLPCMQREEHFESRDEEWVEKKPFWLVTLKMQRRYILKFVLERI